MINKLQNKPVNEEQLLWPFLFSVLIHLAIIFIIVYKSQPPRPPDFVKAELWSSLPPEVKVSEIQEDLTRDTLTERNSNEPIKKSKKKLIKDVNDPDLISIKEKARKEKLAKEKAEKDRIAKEKARKEKLAKEKAEKDRIAKEKARKEKLIKDQRKAELEQLKKTLSGLDINAKKLEGGVDSKKQSGVTDGSDKGKRVGQLSNYSERIRTSIRRKIVFDITKTQKNPLVIYKVTRTVKGLEVIEKIKPSGNKDWDTAVADAIRRSVPLPDPNQKEINSLKNKLPPNSLELSFRPRE